MKFLRGIIRYFAVAADQKLIDDGADWFGLLRVVARIHARHLWFYFAALTASSVFVAASGADVYHKTEAPQFCASCHEMGTNFASWELTAHKDVACIQCHARGGIMGYVEAKLGGTRQLIQHLTASKAGEIRMGNHERQIVVDNCTGCHKPEDRKDDGARVVFKHASHVDKGVWCVSCHGHEFAHPDLPLPGVPAPIGVLGESTAKCHSCHDGKQQFQGATAFLATDLKNCAKCHEHATKVFDHGGKPWEEKDRECSKCHEIKEGATHFEITGTDESLVCVRCHEEVMQKPHVSKHGGFGKRECGECHRVMEPAEVFGKGNEPTSTFCFECHDSIEKRIKGKPPYEKPGLFVAEGKDMHKKHGKLFDSDETWCRTCHAGHGSQAERAMLELRNDAGEVAGTWTPAERGGTCQGPCHEDAISYEWEEGAVRAAAEKK